MTTASYITDYLPAAIIALLLAMVVALLWRLIQATRRQRVLERKVDQLQAKCLEMERRDVSNTENEKEHRKTDNNEDISLTQQEEVSDNVFVTHVDQLITRNIAKSEFTACTIAEVMHLSRAQLDRRMKHLTGKTATAYLLDRRMTYARELLLTTRMPIADVAIASGFEDTSYFTRVFRGHYQCTPSEVRKKGTKSE